MGDDTDWDEALAQLLGGSPAGWIVRDDVQPPWLALIPREAHGPLSLGARVRFAPRLVDEQPLLAWHTDLRVVDEDAEHVHVVTEAVWWRGELTPRMALAHSRVWVEQHVSWSGAVAQLAGPAAWVRRVQADPLHPGPIPPTPARLAGPLTGRRAIITSPTEASVGWRVVAEPHDDPDLGIVAVVMREGDWYQLLRAGGDLSWSMADLRHIWIES